MPISPMHFGAMKQYTTKEVTNGGARDAVYHRPPSVLDYMDKIKGELPNADALLLVPEGTKDEFVRETSHPAQNVFEMTHSRSEKDTDVVVLTNDEAERFKYLYEQEPNGQVDRWVAGRDSGRPSYGLLNATTVHPNVELVPLVSR